MRDLLSTTPLLRMTWIVALCAFVPLGVGILLDHRLRTTPLFLIVGAAIGILASTIGAIRIATRTIDALGDRPPSDPQPAERAEQKED
jgi:F0F1-type ATP synthase assembly protein I